ncbi:chemotaxis protein CheW [Paenibacillus sp. Soil766]|uniref:chemotaxis protein CheW n=1 Tax=Paenibacillus sp. Soil766 TaxID=1736404 RepID=UPI00070DED37|nr:chemotaxis protein CheW [Paenibacillus sp. Soil766]KRF09991.1 chemotaxis protein CheW [Paenibacillus sp. Soil766]
MQRTEQEQYVELGIGNETYAIRIQDIHEIIKMQDVTQIPNALGYLKGVINLRGRIIPVISLRNMFGLMEEENTKFTRIVVVNHVEDTVGVIVDRVNKVTNLSDIQPPPDRVGGISGNYFAGIGITDHGLVGILKLEEVLLRN